MLKQFLVVLRAEKNTSMITMRFIVVRLTKITIAELAKNTTVAIMKRQSCVVITTSNWSYKMTIKEAFEQFDALRVANALGLEYGVVCKWRDREQIPAYWRVKFVNVMNHHGVSISLHDLAGWITK